MKCRYRDIDIFILLTGSGRAVELVLEDGDTGVGGPASGGRVPALPRANLNTGRLLKDTWVNTGIYLARDRGHRR